MDVENCDGDDIDVGVVGFENERFFVRWLPLFWSASDELDLKMCKSLLKLEILPPPPLVPLDMSFDRLYFGETDDARPQCNLFDVDRVVVLPLLPIDE